MDEHHTGVTATSEPDRRTVEIRAEIAQTREEMSDTVNAIQDRLRPSSIAAASTERLKQAASDKARELADSEAVSYAADNPVPMMMVGIGLIGLGWLAVTGRNRDPRGRDGRRYREALGSDWRSAPGYRPATREYGQRYGRDHEELGGPSRADVHEYEPDPHARPRAGASYGRPHRNGGSRTSLQRTWTEHPLVVGAAAAVVGALAGLGLPESDRENRLMGETRDSLVEAAQDTVREKVEEVQQAASAAVGNLQQAAKSAVGLGSEQA